MRSSRRTASRSFYGDFQALFGVDFAIDEGETVAIIGANGAGKSSFMNALSGPRRGRARARSCSTASRSAARKPFDMVKLGIALVPEGRKLFPSLTVEENLLMGASGRTVDRGWTLDGDLRALPDPHANAATAGADASGGQQQMVAIGRALMANPRILLCDEISLGLVAGGDQGRLRRARRDQARGTTVLIVEQDLTAALKAADRVYCFMEGRVSLTGRPGELTRDADPGRLFRGARVTLRSTPSSKAPCSAASTPSTRRGSR